MFVEARYFLKINVVGEGAHHMHWVNIEYIFQLLLSLSEEIQVNFSSVKAKI